uniref:Uncharacterized protein n=1 Tax=Timema bartmani TaxID=61472 RepID=A0A7R9I6S9_9NEOP|nr:unnamed protein product [Timema bartmani]
MLPVEDGYDLDAIEMLMPDANGGLSTRSNSDTLYEDTNSGSHLYKVEDVCIDSPKLTPSLQRPACDNEGEGLLNLNEEAEMDQVVEQRVESLSATFQQAASSVNRKKFASMAKAKKDLAILRMELLKRECKYREAHMIEIHKIDVKIKRAQLEILLDQKKVDVAQL